MVTQVLNSLIILGIPTAFLSVLFSHVLPQRLRARAAYSLATLLALMLWTIAFLADG